MSILWSIGSKAMLGFEPVIAINTAVSECGIKRNELKDVSYVDVSDLLTVNSDNDYLSIKGYIIKLSLLNEDSLNSRENQYLLMYVLLDENSYKQCYSDNTVSAEIIESEYIKSNPIEFSLENIQFDAGESDYIKYGTVGSENKENSKTDDGTGSQKNNSSQELNYCLVCGKTATHSMTGIASGELEWYCDEHWEIIQDTIGDMEQDVGESTESKHKCQAPECSKEGTNQIMGISGEYEYYCTEHYQEMIDLINKMSNGNN